MSAITKKKKIRGGHKAHLQKLLTSVEEILREFDMKKEVELLGLRDMLKRKAEVLSQLDEEIIMETAEEEMADIEDMISVNEATQEKIQGKITEIDVVLKRAYKIDEEAKRTDVKSEPKATAVVEVKPKSTIRLPKCEIKKFTGDPKSYREFWDAFTVAIDDCNTLSDVEKFTYLKSYVAGDAEEAIKGLSATDANYKMALGILQQRYGNTQVIVNSHMRSLTRLTSVHDDRDTKRIRKLYDQIETDLRSLKALGVQPDGLLLVPLLLEKFPEAMNLRLSRRFQSNTDVWNVDEMMHELRKELEARERCVSERQRKQKEEPLTVDALIGKLRTDGYDVDQSALQTLFVGQQQSRKGDKQRPRNGQQTQNRRQPKCPFCNGDHYADKCMKITDVAKRKNILMKKNLCFVCCRANHKAANCMTERGCYKCTGRHHTSICESEKSTPKDDVDESAKVEESLNCPALSASSMILLQTAQLDVRADRGKRGSRGLVVNCKVLLDSCSQRTHVTRELAEKINAPIVRRDKVQINGFGGISLDPASYEVAQLILTKMGCNVQLRIQAMVVDTICKPLKGKYVQGNIRSFPHILNKRLADDDMNDELQEVSILIGLEYYYDIINGGPIKVEGAPTIVPSIFGFVVAGDVGVREDGNTSVVTNVASLLTEHMSNEELFESVRDFFNVQSNGMYEKEEEHREEEFEIGIEKREDRYFVNYPFKADHPPLCDNYRLALKRLHGVCRRLSKDTELRREYCAIMDELEKNGIIEEVPEAESKDTKLYYMPHHPVIRNDKQTSKVRIVNDCTSKEDGASLNECSETGKCLFADLMGVAVRFRCHKIGMTADIKQAFLQIGVKRESRDVTRFLWIVDPRDMENITPRIMRFTRVVFGCVSSMAILDEVNRHHLNISEVEYPKTVALLRDSMYCDDFNGGADDDDSGFTVYTEVKQIFQEAGMDMRKWVTNSPRLSEKIHAIESKTNPKNDDAPSYAATQLNPNESARVKMLGIPWDTSTDELCFTLDSLKDYPKGNATKRMLLSGTTKPFDPLGILAPVILTLKILFQSVCSKGDIWDNLLPARQQEVWDRFLEEVKEFRGLKVPRWYGDLSDGSVILMGFGDASESAYAACIYLRCRRKDGTVTNSLVAAKTRVAPVKKSTMPRLELLAALCLSQLMTKIKECLEKLRKIERIVCLTDAEIVLNWIQREGRAYKQFVNNRCNKIRKRVAVDAWYHVPGKQNAADFPSRGCFPRQLQQDDIQYRWLYGPDWIYKEEDDWPIRKDIKHVFDDPELKDSVDKTGEVSCLVAAYFPKPTLQNIIRFEDFSSLSRLVRVVAWCKRFITNCRKTSVERQFDELGAEEYEDAKGICIQSIQGELKLESGHVKRAQSLGIYDDERGFLRCRGRIGKAKIPFGTRFPILIPRNHVTKLVIREAHDKVFHNGVKETLAEVRSKYWIVKGRQIVKKTLKKCYLCKKIEGLAYPHSATSDLPTFRVGASRAFEAVGVDFCGPLYVRDIYKRGEMNKAYIAINTCTSTRMLHLELTPDLTTAAYVRSHRRFIARRGYPSLMVSDNGKTFKGQELKKFNAKYGIKWRYNLSRAPWWGGMFERMVRSTKRCLKKAIANRKLTYEELNTIMIEVEAVINNRPLVYVEENDKDPILTPSHLFCGRRTLDQETDLAPKIKTDVFREDIVTSVRQINASVDHFWQRWSREYLTELREHHKLKNGHQTNIREGDVVLIKEDGVKRNRWSIGVVQKCIVGRDGVTRGATVKTTNKSGKASILNRPLQKLHPMEITSADLPTKWFSRLCDRSGDDDADCNESSDVLRSPSPKYHGDTDGDGDGLDEKNDDVNDDVNNDTNITNETFTSTPMKGDGDLRVPSTNTTRAKGYDCSTRSTRAAAIAGESRRRDADLEN